MKINFKCECGKRIRAKSKYAGRKMKCPACDSVLVIPKRQRRKLKRHSKSAEACPSCNAPMEPESVLCVSCGFHKGRGRKLKTIVKQRDRRPVTGKDVLGQITIEHSTDHLRITHTWFTFRVIFGSISTLFVVGFYMLLNVWVLAISPDLSEIQVLVAYVLPMFLFLLGAYVALAYCINSTMLEISKERVVVRHGPLPWFGNKNLLSEEVSQVCVRRKRHKEGGRGSLHRRSWYTYDIFAFMKNGARRKLMSGLHDKHASGQLEERIEDFLDIEDEGVKFSQPRFRLAVTGLFLLVFGVLLTVGVLVTPPKDIKTAIGIGVFGLLPMFIGARTLYVAAYGDLRTVEELNERFWGGLRN